MSETRPQIKTDKKREKALLLWSKRLLAAAFLAGVAALLVLAWLPKPTPVDATLVEAGALRVTVDESGRTRVKDRYVVSAPLSGNVARIDLDPGDAVTEGQELAQILSLEPPLMDARSREQAQARVAAAQAAAKQARATQRRIEASASFASREAERQRALAAQGGVPAQVAEKAELEGRSMQEELSSAGFAVRVADYELQVAQAALQRQGARPRTAAAEEQVVVHSPVAGKVLRVLQQSEGVVQAGAPLVEVGDPAALEVVVDVLTSDAVHVRPGAEVVIERWGGAEALKGHVVVVEPSAFTRMSALGVEEQRVNVVIALDAPYEVWQSLGDGYRVEARIVVWEGADVLKVRSSAVFRHRGGWAVYAIRDGTATLVPVEVGRSNGLETQITTGLEAGTQLVLHPSDQVADGAAVEVR